MNVEQIKVMCESIRDMLVNDFDTNGSAAGSYCPICHGRPKDKGFAKDMTEIQHDADCGYTIAIELLKIL